MNYYTDVLKKYAVFNGRATRKEYWMFFLINNFISFILNIVEGDVSKMGLISTIYSLAVLIPLIAVAVRRLHDTGKSGWWILIGLFPLVGFIILIYLLVQKSEAGANAYGANPSSPSNVTPPPTETQPPVTPTN
jgi:uncharacterized membrane protein YhaH (DUF805 family)